ncbi:PAS domain S-box protein [candidate division KSB1 bacterium]|nr:PAS domain S-box protein [candidate division KSB1 bacterium]
MEAELSVLYLNSYHYGYRQSDEVQQTVFNRLREQLPQIDIRHEYMDTKRYDDPSHIQLFQKYLSNKYKNHKFNLIITADDHAFRFIQRYQNRMWPEIPVVFCGLNQFNPDMLEGYPNFTGIIEKSDVEDNVRLIESIHPDAKTLYLINDNTLTGEALRKSEGAFIKRISRFNVLDLSGTDLELSELLQKLRQLPPDAVVVYQNWLKDKSQRMYTHRQVVPMISISSAVPVYGFSELYLNYGIVGGKLISAAEQGAITAGMALRILNGTPPREIEVQLDSHCIYKFDYTQLNRFHISEDCLPQGSIIVNKPTSFFERHHNVIVSTLWVVGLQMVLIIYLVLNRIQRVKAERALRREHQLLQALLDNMPDFIYFKDRESRFIQNNKAHLAQFGLTKQEDMLGKSNFDFYSKDFAQETLVDEKRIIETGQSMVNKLENISSKKDKPVWMSTTKVPIKDDTGHVTTLVGISRDVTERVLSSDKIKASLEEKEILLKEIHHRVKNNLQVISSLLSLQASTITDEDVLHALKESQDRIRSMAMIHESLYRGDEIADLDLNGYVNGLVQGLYSHYRGTSGTVRFQQNVETFPIAMDVAVPFGLVLNELISNALKHAFPAPHKNEAIVQIKISKNKEDEVQLHIIDNGKGFPDDFNWETAETLGMKLVRILIENQLRGRFLITNDQGTHALVHFPVHK